MLDITIPNPAAKPGGDDFSSYGTPVDAGPAAANDFSAYGAPVTTSQTRQPMPAYASAARGAVNVATMGFGDSIGVDSAAIGLGGALYAKAHDAITGEHLMDDQTLNQATQQGQEIAGQQGANAYNDNPVSYIAGNIPAGAAGFKSMAENFPRLFAGASPEAGVAKRVAGNLKAGAAFGAVQGALSTPGDVVDRAGGAGVGAIVGAPLAAAGGEAGRVLANGVGYVGNKLGITPSLQTQVPAANDVEREFINQNYGNDKLLSQVPSAQDAMYTAKQKGIQLTPGEVLNNDALIAQQGTLARRPGGVEAAQELREARQKTQLPNALESEISKISPVASPDDAGQGLIQGAENLQKEIRTGLNKQAEPHYEQAYAANRNMDSPMINKVLATPAGKTALQAASTKMKNDMSQMGSLDPEFATQAKLAGTYPKGVAKGLNLRTLDYVKRAFDEQITKAQNLGEYDNVRILAGLKNKFVNALDEADVTAKFGPGSGLYAQGRRTYEEGAPELEKFIEGRMGSLARVKDVGAPNAPNQLLNGSVAQTQEVANRLPREAQAAAAGIIQNAAGNLKGENVGTIQKKIFNTPKQQEQFRAMLGDKYKSFADLMDVMERVNKGQTAMQGSPTAPLLEQTSKMDDLMHLARQAKDDKAGFAKTILGKLFSVTPEAKTAAENKKYADLGNILLTQRGLDLLETMSELKPSVEQARKILGLVQYGTTAGSVAAATNATKGILSVKKQNQ